MASFINSVDARTQLAGTNRLEVLLFSLGKDETTGREEVFGINVVKVREVMHVPKMDGYVLTRKIKEDQRFNDIPVIMHSSLTADAKQNLGKGVGADAYVPMFQPHDLATTLTKLLD